MLLKSSFPFYEKLYTYVSPRVSGWKSETRKAGYQKWRVKSWTLKWRVRSKIPEAENKKQKTKGMRLEVGDKNRHAGSGMLELENLNSNQKRLE